MLIVPHASTVLMLSDLVRRPGRTLRLYVNNYKPTPASLRGDLKEVPSRNGYAPITLLPNQWDVEPSDPPVATYPRQKFVFRDDDIRKLRDEPVIAYGYFITNTQGQLEMAEWFENGPYEMREDEDEIRVTPKFAFRMGPVLELAQRERTA